MHLPSYKKELKNVNSLGLIYQNKNFSWLSIDLNYKIAYNIGVSRDTTTNSCCEAG